LFKVGAHASIKTHAFIARDDKDGARHQ